ncbi:MAG: F0F1 ATP synthase subunit epsilon [Candidatus Cloacimonetes bacterium]|nr:F0F1 ATP synthase subunit epsilon [Candidatus Cloacimonadota bacterium]
MEKLKLLIIQPQKIFLETEFDDIIIPGKDGDFGVFYGHTPFISVIRPGILEIYNNSEVTKCAIHDGYVTVENNIVTILCEVVEKADEIDKTRAEAAKERAEKRIKSNQDEVDFRRAEIALRKAIARIAIS